MLVVRPAGLRKRAGAGVAHVAVGCRERSGGNADSGSFTVKLPLPKLTLPVPETVTPPLRLIEPPGAAEIVPWQFTGSAMEPMPAKPVPADIVRVVPTVCVRPSVACSCQRRSPD